MNTDQLKDISQQLRQVVLEMCIRAKTGHVSSSMSSVELLVALYYGNIMRFDSKNPEWENRDRLVISKGQLSPILYTILGNLGFFDVSELNKFAQQDGKFGVHLQQDVPGVELTVGSLGQGFGVSAGIALALKMNREMPLVFSILGDGELYEGSIWETAMFASHNNLNNLIAIIDRNYICATGFTEETVGLEPLVDKWESFGWDVIRIDGHNFEDIFNSFDSIRSRISTKPLVIIADTIKGKGIEHISDQPLWHGVPPKTEEDIELCRKALKGGDSQ